MGWLLCALCVMNAPLALSHPMLGSSLPWLQGGAVRLGPCALLAPDEPRGVFGSPLMMACLSLRYF